MYGSTHTVPTTEPAQIATAVREKNRPRSPERATLSA